MTSRSHPGTPTGSTVASGSEVGEKPVTANTNACGGMLFAVASNVVPRTGGLVTRSAPSPLQLLP
ncbi:MAG TPA: hypothetical protein ENI87_08770 [bacterium]|nr:hypothetical protein [bacterium]